MAFSIVTVGPANHRVALYIAAINPDIGDYEICYFGRFGEESA